MRELLRKARPWAVLMTVTLVAACGDDDPSTLDFSPETADATADAAADVIAPLQGTFEVSSNIFNAIGAIAGFGGPTAVSPMLPFETMKGMRPSALLSRRLTMPTAPTMSAAAAGFLLPDELLGQTFVWDPQAGYVVDEQATGAPANGVRFVYYAVDPFSGQIVEPLNALGYMDFRDASTQSLLRLEIEAVRSAGNVKLADYFVEASITGDVETSGTATLAAQGFVSDGMEQVDFDMEWIVSGDGNDSGDANVAILIENGSADASIELTFEESYVGDRTESEGVFTVEFDNNEAVFEIFEVYDFSNEAAASIDGSLRFNGDEVVIFSGTDEPEFTRPDGSALTSAELDALGRMMVVYATANLFMFEVLFPFVLLLGFSGI